MKNPSLMSLCVSALFALCSSNTAQAAPITVDFNTTGEFSGCSTSSNGPGFASCQMGSATLTYWFVIGTTVLSDAVPTASIEVGGFQLSGGASLSDFAGTGFTLTLFQTGPTVGSRALTGAVSGSVQVDAGQLVWGPVTPQTWDIGQVRWTVALDTATQGIRIDPPASGGAPGPIQRIGGTATLIPTAAVPEPSTLALMSLGLAALGRGARRRRHATIE